MLWTIISCCAAGLAVMVSIYAAVVPGTRGWNGMDDFLLRVGIIGILALICAITASVGLYVGEPTKVSLICLLALSIIPAIAFIVFAAMLIMKLL
jgi:hypothetical protein